MTVIGVALWELAGCDFVPSRRVVFQTIIYLCENCTVSYLWVKTVLVLQAGVRDQVKIYIHPTFGF